MSEYKRWVSYIYSYERGIKSVNTGFVRIESRNGRCRMTVNIKGGYQQGVGLTMYLFYRKGADMIMVYAGEAEFYNGVCEFMAETGCDDVFGSGKNINDMGGVVCYCTSEKFYGSEWDDKPILFRRIILHEDVEHEIPEPEVSEPEMPEPVIPEPYMPKAPGEIPNPGVPQQMPLPTIPEPQEPEAVEEDEGGQTPELERERLESQIQGLGGLPPESADLDDEIAIQQIDDGEALKSDSRIGRIFAKMPGMYPFEDDDIIECVKFEPQDIGVFPMDKWVLANNSFLLHGYYTYRHLIFARRRTVDGPRCMLGVPGMFRDRERFMAGMFGFGKFKSVRGNKNPDYGEFGYWYMDVDMENDD